MTCKICKKEAPDPKATVPGKHVWCSERCWAKENILVKERLKARLPLQWDPREVKVFR